MDRARILTLAGAVFLCSACIARAISPAPALPWWLQENVRADSSLQLNQRVALNGERMTVCRTLINRSALPIVMGKVDSTGNDSGQLLTFILDEQGSPIRQDDAIGHSLYQPPPAPTPSSSADFQILPSRARVSNCSGVALPRRHGHIWIVSTYTPVLEQREFPTSLSSAHIIISRQYGVVRSNLCEISGRRVRCG